MDTGEVRVIPYAGDALRVLGECAGVAIGELSVPAGFAGPPPHVHHDFDEALYVISGTLAMVRGRDEPVPVPTGGLILAPRGVRHTFANPGDRPTRVLGIWTPGGALSFMSDIGAALSATGPPDPELLAGIYRRHNSEIVP
ncbi:cupin domain-containing protein [Pseudonocardia acaciae]|uniref:cupin domain-containing protein n=1 Tax=Pseudonocardia acaciae TaxID=551276 RepID=UPI00048A9F97|nr:cupin domain-containing protein [Pseudonocardia acaciae]